MPDPIVWQDLPKSQSDATTIDEATSAAIAVHNSDPDAHLAELASLEAHRTSEIIDHLAESVLNDKLAATARSFTAIVDINGVADYDNIQDAVDYVNSRGGGTIKIMPGVYTLTADLLLSPLINLLGEGMQITQIVSDSATLRHIYYVGGLTPHDWDYNLDPFYEGDTFLTNAAGDWDERPVVGQRAYIDFAPGPAYWASVVDADAGGVEVDTPAPADAEDEQTIEFRMGGTVQDGSTTFALAGTQTASVLGIFVGMQIKGLEADYVGYVQQIVDDQTILLTVPFSGDDGTYAFDYYFTGSHSPYIEGVSFGSPATPVQVATGTFGFKLECIRCEFLSGGAAVYWNPTGFIGFLEEPYPLLRLYDCFIFCDSSNPAIYATYGRFEACQFLPLESGARGLQVLYGLWVTDCLFGDSSFAGTYTNNKWVETYGDANYIGNSRFYDTLNLGIFRTTEANGLYYIVLEGCYIAPTTNQTISLLGTRNRITACDFLGDGSTTFTLSSSFSNSVYVGNVHKKTLTDSSTNCAVGNNVTYT